VERSLAVARLWHASIVRTVARMNRTGDRREARHYLERELRFFQRYGKGLAGSDALDRTGVERAHAQGDGAFLFPVRVLGARSSKHGEGQLGPAAKASGAGRRLGGQTL
jgi:hypothetical protein